MSLPEVKIVRLKGLCGLVCAGGCCLMFYIHFVRKVGSWDADVSCDCWIVWSMFVGCKVVQKF